MAGSLAQSSIVEQGGLATVVRRPGRSLAGTSPIPVSMGRSSGPPYRCLPSQAARTAGCLAPDHFSTIPQQSQRGGAAGRQRATRKTPDARFQIARFHIDLCPWSSHGPFGRSWARIACHGAWRSCRKDGFRSAAASLFVHIHRRYGADGPGRWRVRLRSRAGSAAVMRRVRRPLGAPTPGISAAGGQRCRRVGGRQARSPHPPLLD